MVGASEAIRVLGIPRTTFYRLIEEDKIPVHSERKPWQKRAVNRFKISEIRTALKMDTDPPAQ